MTRRERGSAPLESIFAIAFLMALALGISQLALTLYGRNVVIASAHEGARAATELGRDVNEAEIIARRTTRSAAGSLVEDLEVIVNTQPDGDDLLVTVRLSGQLASIGPVPLALPIEVLATSVRPGDVE
ncbi:MAG: TadE/TadG family type IV pilus assembly protein [Actinomycetota bacterium]